MENKLLNNDLVKKIEEAANIHNTTVADIANSVLTLAESSCSISELQSFIDEYEGD